VRSQCGGAGLIGPQFLPQKPGGFRPI